MSCLQLYKTFGRSMHHEANYHNSRVFELRILAVTSFNFNNRNAWPLFYDLVAFSSHNGYT